MDNPVACLDMISSLANLTFFFFFFFCRCLPIILCCLLQKGDRERRKYAGPNIDVYSRRISEKRWPGEKEREDDEYWLSYPNYYLN